MERNIWLVLLLILVVNGCGLTTIANDNFVKNKNKNE